MVLATAPQGLAAPLQGLAPPAALRTPATQVHEAYHKSPLGGQQSQHAADVAPADVVSPMIEDIGFRHPDDTPEHMPAWMTPHCSGSPIGSPASQMTNRMTNQMTHERTDHGMLQAGSPSSPASLQMTNPRANKAKIGSGGPSAKSTQSEWPRASVNQTVHRMSHHNHIRFQADEPVDVICDVSQAVTPVTHPTTMTDQMTDQMTNPRMCQPGSQPDVAAGIADMDNDSSCAHSTSQFDEWDQNCDDFSASEEEDEENQADDDDDDGDMRQDRLTARLAGQTARLAARLAAARGHGGGRGVHRSVHSMRSMRSAPPSSVASSRVQSFKIGKRRTVQRQRSIMFGDVNQDTAGDPNGGGEGVPGEDYCVSVFTGRRLGFGGTKARVSRSPFW